MSIPPTQRQLALLRFIAGYLQAHDGVSPTFAECAAGVGLAGKSGTARLLDGLEERGLIRRLPGRTRAIELLVDVPVPQTPDGAPLFSVPWHYKAPIVGKSLREYPTFAGARQA